MFGICRIKTEHSHIEHAFRFVETSLEKQFCSSKSMGCENPKKKKQKIQNQEKKQTRKEGIENKTLMNTPILINRITVSHPENMHLSKMLQF